MSEKQGDPEASLEDLIDRFVDEQPADVEAFLAKHPEHAEELRRMLPAMEAMEGAAEVFDSGDPRKSLERHARWKDARERLVEGATLSEPSTPRDSDSNKEKTGSSEVVEAQLLVRLDELD